MDKSDLEIRVAKLKKALITGEPSDKRRVEKELAALDELVRAHKEQFEDAKE